MKRSGRLFVLIVTVSLLGCGNRKPRNYLILPDLSGSIDRAALDEAFRGIDHLASRLHRGDRITVVPILDDAQAEISGRIIKFEVPVARQAYDADLHSFRVKLKNTLEQLETSALRKPGARTDLLGSIAVARQEFDSQFGAPRTMLLILSDFIQEDREMNFRTNEQMRIPSNSAKLAEQLAKADPLDFRNTSIYLGLLRSNEYAQLSHNRRSAVKEFWLVYFKSLGGRPQFLNDGVGLLQTLESK